MYICFDSFFANTDQIIYIYIYIYTYEAILSCRILLMLIIYFPFII